MKYRTLSDFIAFLEKKNELIRIKKFVNPVLEITEIVDRISKEKNGGKALLFENNGTKLPLLINAFGSEKRICYALNVNNLDEVGQRISELFSDFTKPKNFLKKIQLIPDLNKIAKWFPKSINTNSARCQQNIILDPDLSIFPVLKCWPADGGKFITLPIVITKDIESGIRNVGMYRMQIFEKNMTGMHWHKHKVGARHFQYYKKKNIKMPVAVILGGDPIYTYAATAPLPDNFDEFLFAGFLLNRGIQMVKCKTQDIEVPEDADIVIEGYIDPSEDLIMEGPFGDHTGFYSLADLYPRFHVTCITHANDAVYPATIVGIPPQEDAWIGKATERIFLKPIKMSILPEIIDIDLPFEGVAHNISLINIDKQFDGHPNKVMNALWGAGQMMFNKVMLIFDKHHNIHNYNEILKLISNNVVPDSDIYFSKGPADILDHSSEKSGFGSKLMIDVTNKNNSVDSKIIASESELMKIQEIISINMSFVKQNISFIIIGINKNKKNHISEISNEIFEKKLLQNVKFIIFVDKQIDVNDISTIIWYVANNIDPYRDCKIKTFDNGLSAFIIDGTVKTMEYDDFKRDWPNIVSMNKETIEKIDTIWHELGFSEKLFSPSIKYFNMVQNEGAIYKV